VRSLFNRAAGLFDEPVLISCGQAAVKISRLRTSASGRKWLQISSLPPDVSLPAKKQSRFFRESKYQGVLMMKTLLVVMFSTTLFLAGCGDKDDSKALTESMNDAAEATSEAAEEAAESAADAAEDAAEAAEEAAEDAADAAEDAAEDLKEAAEDAKSE